MNYKSLEIFSKTYSEIFFCFSLISELLCENFYIPSPSAAIAFDHFQRKIKIREGKEEKKAAVLSARILQK